jgi:hypothetical protein
VQNGFAGSTLSGRPPNSSPFQYVGAKVNGSKSARFTFAFASTVASASGSKGFGLSVDSDAKDRKGSARFSSSGTALPQPPAAINAIARHIAFMASSLRTEG